MEINKIVKGHINEIFNINEDVSKNRLKICYRCPLYLNKFGGICNRNLWLNPNNEDVSIEEKPGYIRGCACRLLAKTRLIEAHCPAGKW